MRLTVIRSRYVPSWPTHVAGEAAYLLDAGAALRRAYSTDAHCAAYTATLERRLSSGALGRTPIAMEAVLVDVDCTAVHGTSEPVPDAWRGAELAKVQALHAEHPGLFAFDTRGGYRIVYALPEPCTLETRDDARLWSRFYRVTLAYLARRFGIEGDPACCDWTRLYRLPRATRDQNAGPERRATFGDADDIGVLVFDPSDEDVAIAARSGKPAPTRELDLGMPGAVGSGLLYWLLRLRGDVGREAPRGGWIALCPNRGQHTSITDGTDSTVVFPACAGGEIGALACLHGHCSGLTLRDWLGCFSDAEKDEARKMAGINPRGRRAA